MAKEKKKSTFFKDFKDFITKGNIIDMAVGVIIGGAFGKIVSSLVADIVMPPIGLAIGGVKFDELKWVLKAAELDTAGEVVKEAVSINYGNFIQTIIEFIIIALCIFLVLRAIVNAKKLSERKKIAEAEAKAAEEKAKADAEAAAAKEAEEAAAARKAELEASALKQEALLTEIRDLLKNR